MDEVAGLDTALHCVKPMSGADRARQGCLTAAWALAPALCESRTADVAACNDMLNVMVPNNLAHERGSWPLWAVAAAP